MTAPRDPDRLIDAFLGTGPTELPERTYDAVRDHIEHTRQRVVIGPWREPTMSNLARVAIAAAAVLAVAVRGEPALPSTPGIVGGPGPSPHSPIAHLLGGAVGAARLASPFTPETLVVDAPFAARLEFTATSDFELWGDVGEAGKGWYKQSADPPNGLGVSVWKVDNARADMCGFTDMDPPIGPSVDDLADVLVKQPHTVVHEDSPVTLDGYSGRYLDYTADLRTVSSSTAGRPSRPISRGARRRARSRLDPRCRGARGSSSTRFDFLVGHRTPIVRPCARSWSRSRSARTDATPSTTAGSSSATRPIHQWPTPAASDPARPRSPGRAGSPRAGRRCLRVVGEGHELRGDVRRPTSTARRDEPAVVGGAAGLDAAARELERAGEGGQRRRVEDEPRARRPRHLQAVTQQAEAGDVGRGARCRARRAPPTPRG